MENPDLDNGSFFPDKGYLQLSDGRQLCFSQFGAANGIPVIYCHGFPASRMEALLTENSAKALGIRIIAIDRPGYGESTFNIHRRLNDWPADVKSLTDHLGVNRFSVLGVSGGGPYAVACAQQFGPQVKQLSLVCPLDPLDADAAAKGMGRAAAAFIALMRNAPGLAKGVYQYLVGPFLARYPQLVLKILTSTAPEADRVVLQDPGVSDVIRGSIKDAFRQGTCAAAWDLYLYVHHCDINPQEICAETDVWHGEADQTVPVDMGRNYVLQIPNCRGHYLPQEGHFSLPVRHMNEILSAFI